MRTASRRPARADLIAGAVALGLFAVAAVTGGVLYLLGHPVHASAAPLFAQWLPHLGPGTPLAVLVAGLVCLHGPALAVRLSWWRLSLTAYAASMSWILALALIDGWRRGIAGRLTTVHEYLHEVPGVTDVPAMLRGFTGRILDFQPDSWTTHVSGHPPGALLIFVGLDRIGLGGGAWAGLACILAGALTAVAVPATVRLLGTDDAARAAVPFVVLFPGAVWIGVSADGLFAGVSTAGIALLAYGVTRGALTAAFAGGILLGFSCYLSYGLVLLAPIVLAVLLLGHAKRKSLLPGHAKQQPLLPGHAKQPPLLPGHAKQQPLLPGHAKRKSLLPGHAKRQPLLPGRVEGRLPGPAEQRDAWWATVLSAVVGAAAVAVAFTVAGFDWLAGYHLVTERYYQGIAAHRPYAYWVWADLAILAVSTGPAAAAILRRAAREARSARPLDNGLTAGPDNAEPADDRRSAGTPEPAGTPQPAGIAELAGATTGPAAAGTAQPRSADAGPARGTTDAGRGLAAGADCVRPTALAWRRWPAALFVVRPADARWLLPLAAAVAIAAADLSGYSKAEVERIWLPFAVWFLAGASLLPPADRRWWLATQAAVALIVNHLLLTTW